MFPVGDFTVGRYGTILLLCGLLPMALGVVSDAAPRYRPLPYVFRPKASVAEQHAREERELKARTAFLQNSPVIGAVPVGIGLLLMWI